MYRIYKAFRYGAIIFTFSMGLFWISNFLKIETKKPNSLKEYEVKCFPRKQVPRYSVDDLSFYNKKYLQIAFAKTHKTGSSTLQNIFFRYGDRNNLNFVSLSFPLPPECVRVSVFRPCLRIPGCFLTKNLSMLPWWTIFPGPDMALICSYSTGDRCAGIVS